MSRLEGKIAVITGGSSGIGLATARRFVEEGAYVYITGRRQSELDKAVKLIGREIAVVSANVNNSARFTASPTLTTASASKPRTVRRR